MTLLRLPDVSNVLASSDHYSHPLFRLQRPPVAWKITGADILDKIHICSHTSSNVTEHIVTVCFQRLLPLGIKTSGRDEDVNASFVDK